MQDAAVKVKTIIMIEGQVFTFEGNGENVFECTDNVKSGVIAKMIKAKYESVRGDCRSDADAILETSVLLNISERSVYRYVKGY